MTLQAAVELIQRGIDDHQPAHWADLGCGDGLFTNALGQLLKSESTIYAVDENKNSLNKIKAMKGLELKKIAANFETDALPLDDLDGILMANSLHFVNDKITFLKKAIRLMKKESSFVIVEYDTDKSNRWVPFPISFVSLEKLFTDIGFSVREIGKEDSMYNQAGMYCALAFPL